ncbi:MAG: leucine--tRNA ligase [Verrucomicrobia bacterium CG_4_10_14_3_um_filter_43_23]|nr:MAG: leucine--tRNA ligase [Verrucomicrobia bacterium CG22_combo_CG10-13_8_21_14_all_43_17]PIX58127.1 MAG: leucine--tRNA ligase [Verrucomicrobia bacterium CG_4_10_14_3_um_filter_43_23]PIY60989.1 MAG: leucine--tRNA ligase [Verrucomicrobia bacterium CG_4_10_14_0_8_um_filter_43_34]PJA43567.1 MAG: leucine--tRNA ligase [Verrucomicrobia bacterium CG_4_9_14_3_um_filter_43_20]
MATNCTDYDFRKIEEHWQSFWDNKKTFQAKDFENKPTYYILDMFPYPSGSGLHIGHPEGYTATDIIGRYKKASGHNVLHPMGWDAFGLPAEQHALSTGIHPAINTADNIKNFKQQLKNLGFGFDWDREINTTDPNYYQWTQWIFLQLFKKGLAYVDEKPVWWCPELATVLANEEVIDGRSERGNYPVERRNLRQWVLRITAYAERLLDDLEDLDWPESTKRQQIAWIGRSEGSEVHFSIDGQPEEELIAFTTRVDTLFGTTYIAVAPEHPILSKIVTKEHSSSVNTYIEQAKSKSDLNRTDLAKDKSGEFTGSYAINPINNARIPIWVADYVLMSYGTGVVMGVPAHDDRDYEFTQKFNLPVIQVLEEEGQTIPFKTTKGKLIHSGPFDGLSIEEGKKQITEALVKNGHGRFMVNYKLRDWLFSRQRYWGEPFPIIWFDEASFQQLSKYKDSPFQEFMPKESVQYTQNGKVLYAIPLPRMQLPLLLPEVESYKPSGTGESPLAHAESWLNVWVNLKTGEIISSEQQKPEGEAWVAATRETNTMPQWAGSCWYYLRYLDPRNNEGLVDKKLEDYWKMPDLYVGGAEHAVLHLLYARFWHQVLFDLGIVSDKEPFKRLVHQGIILGEMEYTAYYNASGEPVSDQFRQDNDTDSRTGELLEARRVSEDMVEKKGEHFVLKGHPDVRVDGRCYKMSKSRGNVVNPDQIIAEYGADSLRLYEMFLGPLEAMKPWNTKGIEGVVRFLRKTWRVYIDQEGAINKTIQENIKESEETDQLLHATIKKVTDDIEALRFNTAISQMMVFTNHLQKAKFIAKETAEQYLQLIAPFAPHFAEELWERLGNKPSIVNAPWPTFEAGKLESNEAKVIIQVNGKLRGEILVTKGTAQGDVLAKVKALEKVAIVLEGKTIVKEIYVPEKIVNLVVK